LGFRRNRGTREAIFRIIIEKHFGLKKFIYVAFVDSENAFDNVKWDKLFCMMEQISLDFNESRIINELYKR